MRKRKQKSGKIVALVLALIFAFSVPAQEAHAEEAYSNENTIIKVAVANMNPEYGISDVQPITTLLDCEIIMAFKMDEGLCMSFTTASMGIASVIGVQSDPHGNGCKSLPLQGKYQASLPPVKKPLPHTRHSSMDLLQSILYHLL